MKIGKVSQTVLKRSILKPITFRRDDSILETTMEEMCFGVECQADEQILSTNAMLYGNEKDLGVFALAQVANDLATRGARPVGVHVHLVLPPHAYESRLKAMVEHIEEAGSARGIQILGAKAEVSPAVKQAIVSVQGLGVLRKGELLTVSMGKPGQDIVLLKWIGLEGTLRALRAKKEELEGRFIPTFLQQIRQMGAELFSTEAIDLAREHGASAMQQITGGGILGTLWEMAESSDVGLEVELKKMSIRQETVEICEFCHLNPYQLTSAGCVLIFTDRGEALVERYEETGVCATLLGRTTDGNDRVILGGEEKRFLDRPAADELLKLYEDN